MFETELISYAKACVVQVHDEQKFLGTGFFVAPGAVLTCAHVASSDAPLKIVWNDHEYRVTGVSRFPDTNDHQETYYPLPDAALLQIAHLDHPCALVSDLEIPRLDDLTAIGYTAIEVPGESSRDGQEATLGIFSLEARGWNGAVLRVKGDFVNPGMSGAPVLDLELGRVVAVVKAVPDIKAMGRDAAWLVPISLIQKATSTLQDQAAKSSYLPWMRINNRKYEDLFDWTPDKEKASSRPSAWLSPGRQAVPFYRTQQYEFLLNWALEADPGKPLIQIIHAPGGTGKTRLAVELVAEAGRHGWIAGIISYSNKLHAILDWLTPVSGESVLIVVDYAETMLPQVRELLEAATTAKANALRIILLARSIGPWLTSLTPGPRTSSMMAPPRQLVSIGSQDPINVITEAYQAFRRTILNEDEESVVTQRLPPHLLSVAMIFARPLDLHAAALAAALNERDHLDYSGQPLETLLMHERRYWTRLADSQAQVVFPPIQRLSDLVLSVPAIYRASSMQEAETRVRKVIENKDARLGQASAALTMTLAYAYPAESKDSFWGGITPDRLGEYLVEDILGSAFDDASAVSEILVAASPCDKWQAPIPLVILARICGLDQPEVLEVNPDIQRRCESAVEALMRGAPEIFVPACIHVCSSLARPGFFVTLLERVVLKLKDELLYLAADSFPMWNPALANLAAEVEERIVKGLYVKLREDPPLDEVSPIAERVARLAERYIDIGRGYEAKSMANAAVRISRALAEEDPRHLPGLAENLVGLGHRLALSDLVSGSDLISKGREREFEDTASIMDAESAVPMILAWSASTTDLHRAVEVTGEGVQALGQLAAANPSRWESKLADALLVLANGLRRVAQIEEARESARQAVAILQPLYVDDPTKYQVQYAASLHICGYILAGEEGGRMMSQAVLVRKALFEDNPLTWGIEFAKSIENQARYEIERARDVLSFWERDAPPAEESSPEQWLYIYQLLLTAFEARKKILDGSLLTIQDFPIIGDPPSEESLKLPEYVTAWLSPHLPPSEEIKERDRGKLVGVISTMCRSLVSDSTDLAYVLSKVPEIELSIYWRKAAVSFGLALYAVDPREIRGIQLGSVVSFLIRAYEEIGQNSEADGLRIKFRRFIEGIDII
jgi:hypothetical protein